MLYVDWVSVDLNLTSRVSSFSKLTRSLFQYDRMQDFPENHFRVSGASWVISLISKFLAQDNDFPAFWMVPLAHDMSHYR